MEFKHRVLFIPTEVDPLTNESIRSVTFTTDDALYKEAVISEAKKRAISDGIIDPYALREYWRPVGGESILIEVPWSSSLQLADQLYDYEVVSEVEVGQNTFETVVVIDVGSESQTKKFANRLKSDYGQSLPMSVKYELIHLFLREKWAHNISLQELNAVFDLYNRE